MSTFELVAASLLTLMGLACPVFAGPLAAKMRRDEAKWGDQGPSDRTWLQTPGRMRIYGGFLLLFAALLFMRAS